MEHVDRKAIDKVIHATSKGSLFYRNEQTKDKRTVARADASVAQCPPPPSHVVDFASPGNFSVPVPKTMQ
jgi:hypothetical protein